MTRSFEDRVEFVKTVSEAHGFFVPRSVAAFVVQTVQFDNECSLVTATILVLAKAILTSRKLTVDVVREALQHRLTVH